MGVRFGDLGVPDGVQVRGGAVEGHGDAVAAYLEVLVVEGLVDVADEVDEEFKGLGGLVAGEGGLFKAGCLFNSVRSLSRG